MRSPTSVGTPFYCYSTATLERHYQGLRRRLRRRARARLLRHEGELQPGGDRDARQARRRRRRGVGRRTDARAARRRAGRQDHVLRASARPRANSRWRSMKAFSASTSNPSRSLNCSRRSLRPRDARSVFRCASIPTSMPKTHAQDRHRQGGEQVRHSDQPRARGLCASGEAARRQGRRRRHAHRQPDHRPASVRRRVRAARRFRAHAARRRPHASAMSISAAAWAFPISTTTSRRRIRTPMPRWSSAPRAISIAG